MLRLLKTHVIETFFPQRHMALVNCSFWTDNQSLKLVTAPYE